MRLYLAQHGDAVPKELDPERPLSDQGREDVRRTANWLARSGVRVSRILHSGKQRAGQTAELLAAAAAPEVRPEKHTGIGPLDSVADFAHVVDGWTTDTLAVGHLPFMGKLVSQLLMGNDERIPVTFRPGTVVCLEREKEGAWHIDWVVRPELAPFDAHSTGD